MRHRLALAALLFALAPLPAHAAAIWTALASTERGAPLDAVRPGDRVVLEINVQSTDRALALAGAVAFYDREVVRPDVTASTTTPAISEFCSACPFPTLVNGIYPSPVERQLPSGRWSLDIFSGITLSGVLLNDPRVQFRIVFDVIGPGSTAFHVGSFAEAEGVYFGERGYDVVNAEVSLTSVPEPNTALLVALGLATLARSRDDRDSLLPRSAPASASCGSRSPRTS